MIIKARDNNDISCPICLDEPLPPVITKCGHIFCWKCIVEYILFFYPEKSCKCPICYHPVTVNDIRVIIWRYIESLEPSSLISLDLCVRNNHQSFVNFFNNQSNELPTIFDSLVESTPGRWFVIAQSSVMDSKSNYLNRVLKFPENNKLLLKLFNSLSNYIFNQINEHVTETVPVNSSLLIIGNIDMIIKNLNKKNIVFLNETLEIDQKNYVLFYQMTFGYNMFLHPANFRQINSYLIKERKNKREYPLRITGSVVRLFHKIVDSQTCTRFKFLSHLPLHSEYTFCLMDLTIPSLGSANIEIHPKTDDIIPHSDSSDNLCYYDRDTSYLYRNPLNQLAHDFTIDDYDISTLYKIF
ncbi:hypothetical protein MXB_2347 [Myxobolus squamalis]|nr:hypothetical protein MXB_2347 [Myxobolus squamalis]